MVRILTLEEALNSKSSCCEILGKNGEHTGQYLPRERIHDTIDKETGRGYLHKVVSCAVFRINGDRPEILYIRGGPKKNKERQKIWLPIISEHVKNNDDSHITVTRALEEEIKITVAPEGVKSVGLEEPADLSHTIGFPTLENTYSSFYGIYYDEEKHGEIQTTPEVGEWRFEPLRFREMGETLRPYPFEFGRGVMRTTYQLIKNAEVENKFKSWFCYNAALTLHSLVTTRNERTSLPQKGEKGYRRPLLC